MIVPTLRTERLTLRPFTLADAPVVQELCSAYEIALNTLMIPHPYPEGMAEQWIQSHELSEDLNFAVEAPQSGGDDGQLVGAMGLILKSDAIGEIGYWIGVPFWNRGYASEAAAAVVNYGFAACNLQRIFAGHYTRNPASGRVMQKAGMTYEGTLRRHQKKWDEYIDIAFYGILREEWQALSER